MQSPPMKKLQSSREVRQVQQKMASTQWAGPMATDDHTAVEYDRCSDRGKHRAQRSRHAGRCGQASEGAGAKKDAVVR